MFMGMQTYNELLPPHLKPREAQEAIIEYVKELQRTSHSPRTCRSYLTAPHAFYVMNDAENTINFKKISKYVGEIHGIVRDRIPTWEELQTLLDKCDL